jgi:hypothetical protein
MKSPLTFRDIKHLFNYIDNDKIVIWELFYKPRKTFFGRIKYSDKKAINTEFEAGLVITILNADNVYYQIVTTAFNLRSEDLLKMVLDPMFIVGDLNMTWLNFLIFKKAAMNIIKGWYYDIGENADITITHAYNRKTNENWQDLYSTCKNKNIQISIDTPIVTEINSYELIASIHSMYTMPDIAMVIRNIESLC